MTKSELIFQFARNFIVTGESMEQEQSRLNAACTAWNIANLPKYERRKRLERTWKATEHRTPVCRTTVSSAKT